MKIVACRSGLSTIQLGRSAGAETTGAAVKIRAWRLMTLPVGFRSQLQRWVTISCECSSGDGAAVTVLMDFADAFVVDPELG